MLTLAHREQNMADDNRGAEQAEEGVASLDEEEEELEPGSSACGAVASSGSAGCGWLFRRAASFLAASGISSFSPEFKRSSS